MALPVESDPITLAKAIATLDHLSGGRVTIGAGFGWNTDELADHHVPAGKRRTVLREYVEAMRALWTQEEASYDGEFVSFGPSWAWPKPVQPHMPLVIGAGGGPKTFRWIAEHRRRLDDHPDRAGHHRQGRSPCARPGPRPAAPASPQIHVLIAAKPSPDDLASWADAGATELIWGVPDKSEDEVLGLPRPARLPRHPLTRQKLSDGSADVSL